MKSFRMYAKPLHGKKRLRAGDEKKVALIEGLNPKWRDLAEEE